MICQKCEKEFDFGDGILAEVVDNKIITDTCNPFTELTELCSACVDELGISE